MLMVCSLAGISIDLLATVADLVCVVEDMPSSALCRGVMTQKMSTTANPERKTGQCLYN